jgi:hypothetical protein
MEVSIIMEVSPKFRELIDAAAPAPLGSVTDFVGIMLVFDKLDFDMRFCPPRCASDTNPFQVVEDQVDLAFHASQLIPFLPHGIDADC